MGKITSSPVPNKSTKSRLVNRLGDTESVRDRKRPDRPSVLSVDHAESNRHTVLRSGRKLPRGLCNCSRLSYGSVQKVTEKAL
jgi:hypothetical protein